MPFTFCHPAIVLPFNRVKSLSLSGLIAGSVAPDFEYFIRMTDTRIYTHTWSGFFLFDLPLALILTFIFHNLIRKHIIFNSPSFLQQRLRRFNYFQWNNYFKKRWLTIVLSTLIGVISHLLWDGFTHEMGFFVQLIPILSSTISISGILVEVHLLLQVLSSIIGGIVILYALWQLPADKKVYIQKNTLPFWLIVVISAFLIFLIRLSLGISNEIEDLIIPIISSILFGIVLSCILINQGILFKQKEYY